MSGHSHFATIKRKKEVTDKKRGQIFSKLSRAISVAAREKGPDPALNPRLKLAIEEARSFNMPKDNIEKAIKKGMGDITGEKLEAVFFEAFGPKGIAIIVEGITDNKNRTLSEIKQILNENSGKLANEGSVQWMFEKKGVIEAEKPESGEDLEMLAIEAGAQDFFWRNAALGIYTKAEDLEHLKKKLSEKGVKIKRSSLDWVAKEEVEVDQATKNACQKLFEALDENEAVQEIYSNIKLP